MTQTMHPTNKAARIAGAIYLTFALTAPFSLIYIPTKLIVSGNASATARNVLANETLFRLGIVADLFSAVIFICVGIALYHLLSDVNKNWARLMLGLVLVSAAVGFVNVLNNLGALILFRGGDFLGTVEKPQRDAFAMLFLGLHRQGIFTNEIFWGLWLFPFGLLVWRSGFLPRILGLWLILNCFAYLALSLTALLFPPYYQAAFRFSMPVLFGELAITLWLLARGANIQPEAIAAPAYSKSCI
jgi:hypothetical protein